MWIVLPNAPRAGNSYTGDIYRTTGPAFNAVPWTPANPVQVGNMSLVFTDGNVLGQLAPPDMRELIGALLAENGNAASDVLETLAEAAFRRLPQKFRALCEDLVIRVEDFPTEEALDELDAASEFDLLGLFQGVCLPFRSESATGQMPNMVWLYRRPILDYWAEHDEALGAIITHVLVHEIGHHFGLSDDDMAAIEASVA